MRTKFSAASIIAGAAAIGLLGAGIASAAPAVSGVPTADFQMCGAVYKEAPEWPWLSIGPPPINSSFITAEGVGGVVVIGRLLVGSTPVLDSSSNPIVYTTVTASDGSWCLSGDSSLVGYLTTSGARVLLANDVPAPKNLNKWETDGIYEADFLDHIYGAFIPPFTFITQSAKDFYMVVP